MELKDEFRGAGLGDRVEVYESIQWNWKEEPPTVIVIEERESIQWNWKFLEPHHVGAFHRGTWIHSMELKVDIVLQAADVIKGGESIQWNWKLGWYVLGGRTSRTGIHSMELKDTKIKS